MLEETGESTEEEVIDKGKGESEAEKPVRGCRRETGSRLSRDKVNHVDRNNQVTRNEDDVG